MTEPQEGGRGLADAGFVAEGEASPHSPLHSSDPTMVPLQTLTLTLDPDLGSRLAAAAERTGLSPADIVLRALRNDLDGVTAYGRITDEVNLVKDGLAALTGLVGQALAEPAPGEVDAFCRYKPAAASSGR
jgi:hypothetical protein